jgi:demethylmacrocin O-methyltransferase
LAQKFGTDKWGTKHRYTPHYEAALRHLRDSEFTLLEIGIGGYSRDGQGGASLRMWRDYFPRASIVGLDLHDKSFVTDDRIHVYQGDQSDPSVLHRIVAEHPDLKVVVDDGSHISEHVMATFGLLFPLLPQGGIYAIEDLQTSYWPEYGGEVDPTATGTSMHMVKSLLDGLNHEEFRIEGYQPSYTDENVFALHAWHNLVIIEKGTNPRRPL